MTSIYLAGKINKNDWRHDLMGWDLRTAWAVWENDEGDPPRPWPVIKKGVLDTFDYVGPYFASDDHGCGHGPGTHGCGEDGALACGSYAGLGLPLRPQVREMCLAAIDAADIVFAWLNDPTAYGTLVEIGYAKGRGKQVIVAAPEIPGTCELASKRGWQLPDSPTNEFWFAFSCATSTLTASTPHEALKQVVDFLPNLESPIEEAFWRAYLQMAPPELNGLRSQHPVFNGRYRLDFALPAQKIGIELDGYAYHSSPEVFTRDRARQRELQLNGWRIISFSGTEINRDAGGCVRQAAQLVDQLKSGGSGT
ncbi:DUF559 domain-containing protein [Streptomyces prunicolor]|uniref:DUF559 domain-containing protein n=1 Tax=Streptomyces prunicolor TaxID=67348 RepID=UPI0003638817|nr:DUF559 domain-containing protein [Streptomyces prunicolor]